MAAAVVHPRENALGESKIKGHSHTLPGRKQTVLARLHELFPKPPHGTPTAAPKPGVSHPENSQSPSPARNATATAPKALKIRIVTWNMHDSVPKGDLKELLGKVPTYTAPIIRQAGIPDLLNDANHPYHIVVVAGQECPSMSGIPMGLGAGFKLIDKDKERDRDRDKDKEKARERDRDYDRPRARHRDREKDEATKFWRGDESPHESHHPGGWTSMIEDWLCNGGGSGIRTGSPTVADVGFPMPLSARSPSKIRKGPYQLLIKERMMGIYLAIYIHRDIRPLVRGTSRDAVTAGLIGGRVGNKGGVGISVNLDGTTLLFLNAHLAAHEGKVNHRLANLSKIKAELAVDDFLCKDDPRLMAEDLTDRFDHTFLCGDLNFRLDISRLHADWLISRQEYTQALAFDQLRKLMQTDQAFAGFNEGRIDFPPTFKYDVVRSQKRKRKVSRLERWRPHHPGEKMRQMTEDEAKRVEGPELEDEEEGGDTASVASSVWTSVSKAETDRDPDDESFHASPSFQSTSTAGSKVSVAAQYSKPSWRSLLSSSSPTTPTKSLKITVNQGLSETLIKKLPTPSSPVDTVPSCFTGVVPERLNPGDTMDKTLLQPPMVQLTSTKSVLPSEGGDERDEKGVYDTSHKKRVPSWCDRILWKSTVEPDYESDEDLCHKPNGRPRTRLSVFFANAFRPLSFAARKDSNNRDAVLILSTKIEPPTVNTDSPLTSRPSSPNMDDSFIQDILPTRPSVQRKPASSSSFVSRHRSISATFPSSAIRERPSRRASASSGPSAANDNTGQQLRENFATRWRFLPSFLSSNSPNNNNATQTRSPVQAAPFSHQRGDVECLGYSTLDDRAMCRLEGRSDHRPVVGSYAVYL